VRFARLTLALLFVGFLDELGSGIPGLGAPEIQSGFDVSYGMAAGWLQWAFLVLALVLEPPLMLLADRYPRRRFVLGGLLALAASSWLAALAPTYALLFAALALWGASSGVGVSLSQATLMDAHPERRERMMARWTLLGSIGDLATPALFALLALFALGWREAFGVAGALFGVAALALWRRLPRVERSPEAEAVASAVPIRRALVEALGNRTLLLWLGAAALCSLLDEILIAFGTLHLRDALGAGVPERSLVFGCLMAGGILGLAGVAPLLDRFDPVRVLVASSGLCVVAYVAWVLAGSVPVSAGLAAVVGATSSVLYPIAKAQAYRALPDRSATVLAVASLFRWADLLILPGLALVADAFGLLPVMLLLAAQPVGILAIALARSRTDRATR
jgi:MFS family permease